ncbi:MAG: thymidine phosphorylase [Pseudomonadota bacterium]
MRAYDIIKSKRDGQHLAPEQIQWLIEGYTRGDIPDYQMAAFAMAVFFQDLADDELGALTQAMLRSGTVLDFSDIPGVNVDKHSTGGVGDKISLPLAPAVAACGVKIPMISGRGLGHTGGTLDKLESIPGFRVDLDEQRFHDAVRDVGCCLIGQTSSLAPADKKLYALRDVTATVDCIPLITSSIMSKKLAEGIDALVLDVKVGSGAFMKTETDARTLARKMVGTGRAMGKQVVAYLTRMDQPLGRWVGNAVETRESIETLHGKGPDDIVELVCTLGGEMLLLAGVATTLDEGSTRVHTALQDGSGAETFKKIIAAQGGDPRVVDDVTLLPQAAHVEPLLAEQDGVLAAIDSEQVGIAAMELGGGRARASDVIDPAVGLHVKKKVGERVQRGEPLFDIHHNDRGVEACCLRLRAAVTLAHEAPPQGHLVIERLA